jgi:hypothetical protein
MADRNQQLGWSGPRGMSHLVIPRSDPNVSFTPLRHLGSPANLTEIDGSEIIDPLIQGLMDRLPKRNGIWTLDDRAKWLRTAASIFGLVYKASEDEQREVGVVLIKQANSAVAALGAAEAISPGFIGQ